MATTQESDCTAIVSYTVNFEDVDDFLGAWHLANDHLKQQAGHISTKLYQAESANPSFRFVTVAAWESADAFRTATQSPSFQEASGRLEAYPMFASAYENVC